MIDIDAELREYQWRRKFERERRPDAARPLLVFAMLLAMLVVIAQSVKS